MRLKIGHYKQAIKLKVPPLYPEEGVLIEFLGSNFPVDIQYMFRCQGKVRATDEAVLYNAIYFDFLDLLFIKCQ